MSDHYGTLGVSPEATQDEIKRAYRKLAREHHPDANQGDRGAEERFKEIVAAYEVLSDPEKRARYDRFGDEGVGAAGFSDIGGIGDLFASFFGGMGGVGGVGAQRQRGTGRGQDLLAEVEITLEEAAAGVDREITVSTMTECSDCDGTGAAPGTTPSSCADCGGTGEQRQVRRTLFGDVMTAATCRRCRGTGEVITDPCPTCNGAGRVEAEEELTLPIPAGIEDGAQLRVSGRGAAGARGGRAGDLFVVIRIEPHEVFRRAGMDLACEVRVPMTIAALGGEVEVPTLEGPEPHEIKPGTQAGEVLRLKGRGMPRVGSRSRGELVGILRVETPTDLDEKQTDLLRALAEERGEPVGEKGLFDKIKEAFR